MNNGYSHEMFHVTVCYGWDMGSPTECSCIEVLCPNVLVFIAGALGKVTTVWGFSFHQCLTFDKFIESRRQGLAEGYWRHTLEIQDSRDSSSMLPSCLEVRTVCHMLPFPISPASPETQSSRPNPPWLKSLKPWAKVTLFFSCFRQFLQMFVTVMKSG